MSNSSGVRYHHGDLEHALTVEALDQVRRRGAESVSLRQVAQAVGVSASAAYSHFPDKTALMVAVAGLGLAELDERMVTATAGVPGDDDAAALARFRVAGQTYVRFALDEPHLFRHVFGPTCGLHLAAADESSDGRPDQVSYQVLCRTLDDLDERGMLRPGAGDGLDLVAWTMVHGFASLALDGFLPTEVGQLILDGLARLALSDEARELLGPPGPG